jgi:hypothetical protein
MYKYFFKTSLLFWITTAHAQTPCDSTRFNDTLLDKLIGYWDLTGKKSVTKEKKTTPKKPRAKKYDDKTVVTGSFLDIIKLPQKMQTAKRSPRSLENHKTLFLNPG